MSGKASRRKGHNFERWVATQFRPIYGESRRGLQYRDGSQAPDVYAGPFHVECKRRKQRVQHIAALEQASDTAPEDKTPIAVCKEDRRGATVTLWFEDFLKLIAR